MAQLRDKVTSEVVFEGTLEEVAVLGAKLGDTVIFDGVGAADPNDIIQALSEQVDDRMAEVENTATERLSDVEARIEEARARVEE